MTSERVAAEDGNTLVLMPAAVLILLVLAAIAFDAAVVHLQQRRLADLAASLANDAVTALDLDAVYELEHGPAADPDRAQGLAAARRAAFARDDTLQDVACAPAVAGDEVTVTCRGRVVPVFGRALADGGVFEVQATETARADLG